MDDMHADLLDLERRGWDALCDGTGPAFYGDLMTDDGVMVLAHGMALDRGAVVASLDGAPAWDRYEIAEDRTVAVGKNAVALVYRARATRGDEPAFVALMSSVYVRDGGRWRLALYQQTPVPDGGARG